MSSQEQFSASNDTGSRSRAYPDCPECLGPMTVRQLSPVLRASHVDEVVYGCNNCGAETKQNVSRSSAI